MLQTILVIQCFRIVFKEKFLFLLFLQINNIMTESKTTILIFTSVLSIVLLAHLVTSCNEQVCASVVSKCMLTQSCRCDLKNCSCCKECFNCLSYLYSECCSCVGNFHFVSLFCFGNRNNVNRNYNKKNFFSRYVPETK